MSAVISPDGKYRYHLDRLLPRLLGSHGDCLFIMLNPSTADASVDDPTIRRCQDFAIGFGCERLVVVNLFGLRSTAPGPLYHLPKEEAVGLENDYWIAFAADQARIVICAWGNHGALHGRGRAVLRMLRGSGRTPMALKLTQAGQPGHPLYLRRDAQLIPM